jgi:glycosyltransferase involved in cell wall biosynthesis
MGLLGDGRDGGSREQLRRALNIPMDAYVIANIAFDAPFKGVDTLVEALPRVIARCPQTYLIQAGINPERSPLPALASSLGVNEHVRWLGIRDHAHQYLAAADVYVQPSRSGEGFPLAIMEAMRAGVPTIATDVAGNAEAIVDGESGRIVPPCDPAAIADAVVSLFQSRDVGERFVAATSARFHEYFDGRASVSRPLQQHYGIGQRNPPDLRFPRHPRHKLHHRRDAGCRHAPRRGTVAW